MDWKQEVRQRKLGLVLPSSSHAMQSAVSVSEVGAAGAAASGGGGSGPSAYRAGDDSEPCGLWNWGQRHPGGYVAAVYLTCGGLICRGQQWTRQIQVGRRFCTYYGA